MGYTLPAAIADIVDNSIDAGASTINVTLMFEGDSSWVRISDDGSGMSRAHLDEAMRYGTRARHAAGDLGRFGLGLKTASLSQCRTLTVATRRSPDRRRIEVRRWSLDHVAKHDRWELLGLRPAECRAEIVDPLADHPGTVVFWEGLDRILRYRRPAGGAAENALASLTISVSDHLGMVFHRFLQRGPRVHPRITICVNGDPVRPWDPFAKDETATKILPTQRLSLPTPKGRRQVVVTPHILPREDRFSSRLAHARSAGPRRWNRQQGFYIYRANRLIQSGGWNRIRADDEHTKLARVAVDLPLDCDELFQIDVSKMRVTFPADIRGRFKAIVAGVAAEAQVAYRRSDRVRSVRSAVAESAWVREDPAPSAAAAPYTSIVSGPASFDGRLGLLWEEIESVLVDELRDQPQVLSRTLRRLHMSGRLCTPPKPLPTGLRNGPSLRARGVQG